MYDWLNTNNMMLGGMAGFVGAMLVIALLVGLAFYIYWALAVYTIGKKLKYPYPWLAWIPFANIAMILQLGDFHWAWIFLILVPFLGWLAVGILYLISMWRIYEQRKYPGWLALLPIAGFIPYIGFAFSIANLVVLGMVAWADKRK